MPEVTVTRLLDKAEICLGMGILATHVLNEKVPRFRVASNELSTEISRYYTEKSLRASRLK